jgi:hypothetical protein
LIGVRLSREDFEKDIAEYLNNPIKHGVLTQTLSFSIYSVESLVKKMKPEVQSKHPKGFLATYPSDFKEFIDYVNWVDYETALYNLDTILRFADYENSIGINKKKRELPICHWSNILAETQSDLAHKSVLQVEYFPDYSSLLEVYDAINISKMGHDKKVFLSVSTVGERGLKAFDEFIRAVPKIGKEIYMSEIRKRHLQRFVYRPFAPALMLWTNRIAFNHIPTPVHQFLNGAISYFRHGEWRTSIVLSAITVEIILAELYEENYQEEAPDVSLGKLIKLLRQKINLGEEIENSISVTNDKRITAVHRGQIIPSEKDAVDALFGAGKLTLWYSKQFV